MARIPSLAIARGLLVAFVLLCLLTFSGCQKQGDLPPTQPVSGRVVYQNGTPMKGGTIQFLPTSPDSSFAVSGAIDQDGGFTLYTLQDKTKVAGAVEGQYQVMILPPQGDKHQPVRPFTLPGTYTIKPGENTFPNLTIPSSSR